MPGHWGKSVVCVAACCSSIVYTSVANDHVVQTSVHLELTCAGEAVKPLTAPLKALGTHHSVFTPVHDTEAVCIP